MAEELLKVWESFEDGAGFPWDNQKNNGYYGIQAAGDAGFVSDNIALRVPPLETVVASVFTSGYTCRYSFQVADSGGTLYTYYLSDNGTHGKMTKIETVALTDRGTVTTNNVCWGHPTYYRGKWYMTGTNNHADAKLMYELTTVGVGAIAGDTLTPGDADSGYGHLAMIGHQMCKVSPTLGVSILTTDASATLDANWGSYFPCGDSYDDVQGTAGLSGLTFVLRNRGLYTFNDRGRAGLVAEDFAIWQEANQANYWGMAPWKGGLVFTHPTGVYYYYPGNPPIPIFLPNHPRGVDFLWDVDTIEPRGIAAIGDFLYLVVYDSYNSDAYLMCGQAKGGNPTDVKWDVLQYLLGNANNCTPVISVANSMMGESRTRLSYMSSSTGLGWMPLNDFGGPVLSSGASGYNGETGATCYLSGLSFPKPVRLTRLVVQTIDMDATTSFQAWMLINAGLSDGSSTVSRTAVGGPMYGNKSHEIKLDQTTPAYTLFVGFTPGTGHTLSSYKGGGIHRVSLYGVPVE